MAGLLKLDVSNPSLLPWNQSQQNGIISADVTLATERPYRTLAELRSIVPAAADRAIGILYSQRNFFFFFWASKPQWLRATRDQVLEIHLGIRP